MLGIQLGTVKSRLHYALRGLRDHLERDRRFGGAYLAPERRGRGERVVIDLGRSCTAVPSAAGRFRRPRRDRARRPATPSPISIAAVAAPRPSSPPCSRSRRCAASRTRRARSSRRRGLAAASPPDHSAGAGSVVMSPLAGLAMSVAMVAVLVLPFRLGSGGELRWDDMPTPTVDAGDAHRRSLRRGRLPGREPASAGERSRGGDRQPPDEHPGGGTSSAEGGALGQAEQAVDPAHLTGQPGVVIVRRAQEPDAGDRASRVPT